MSTKITKAVFPVAGLGTRFFPVTKTNPKEMLPITGKPLIQYAVEEALAAGITELIFILREGKQAITEYFGRDVELERLLAQQGKFKQLEMIGSLLPKGVSCVYIKQTEPLGLGHAVRCARSVIDNEPFVVILSDDLIMSDQQGVTTQLIEQYTQYGHGIIAVEKVAKQDTDKYGIIDTDGPVEKGGTIQLTGMVEKPSPDLAPSSLAIVGRYLLPSTIFQYLDQVNPGANGEIQLTDAIAKLLLDEPVYARRFLGRRYDCGSQIGYIQASIDYALREPELSEAIRQHITQLIT